MSRLLPVFAAVFASFFITAHALAFPYPWERFAKKMALAFTLKDACDRTQVISEPDCWRLAKLLRGLYKRPEPTAQDFASLNEMKRVVGRYEGRFEEKRRADAIRALAEAIDRAGVP